MGDGNHSFATAKSIWMDVREELPTEQWDGHPARYCLVELENIYDPGLRFEPIHRVLFGTDLAAFEAALAEHCAAIQRIEADDPAAALAAIEQPGEQSFAVIDADSVAVYRLSGPHAGIAAGTVQRTIDTLTAASASTTVDYIHGADVAEELGRIAGNVGLLLPPVDKDAFFASIAADGALPRKDILSG